MILTYHNRYFPLVNFFYFIIESMGIFLSVFFAYMLLSSRLESNVINFQDVVYRGVAITIFAQFCLYLLDLYNMRITFSTTEILFSVVLTTGLFYIAVGIFIILIKDFYIERNIFYLAGMFLFVFLSVWRSIFQVYVNNNPPMFNILILGGGTIAENIASLIDNSKSMGFNLVGTWGESSETHDETALHSNPGVVTIGLEEVVSQNKVNRIIVAQEDKRGILPIRDLLEHKINGVDVLEWPEFYEYMEGKIPVNSLPPSYFVFNGGFNVSYFSVQFSRLFSIFFSLIALLGMVPVFLVAALLIKLDSRGKVFYFQERIGEKRKPFNLIKFRTMVEDAERGRGATWATDEDPRVTRVGRILRKYRVDEFPQFINVLRGEMNVVGPRPERPEFVGLLENELPYYSIRHSIKPGITGWAQVKAPYGGTIEESREKLEYDLFYIKNQSFKFDLYIIFKTVKTLILGRGAR